MRSSLIAAACVTLVAGGLALAMQRPPGVPVLGQNTSLGGRRLFPADNPWNEDVSSRPIDPNLPPMGMRVRLKGSFEVSGYPPHARVILTAMKRYGMIVADNGSDWFVSGAPNPRWDERQIETLKRVKGRDFEVVKMGEVVTR